MLDPALTRPGRFDRHVAVPLPDQTGREAVLRTHLARVVAGGDVDARVLARATGGLSGADLAGIVNEAALRAAKEVPGSPPPPSTHTHTFPSVFRAYVCVCVCVWGGGEGDEVEGRRRRAVSE